MAFYSTFHFYNKKFLRISYCIKPLRKERTAAVR